MKKWIFIIGIPLAIIAWCAYYLHFADPHKHKITYMWKAYHYPKYPRGWIPAPTNEVPTGRMTWYYSNRLRACERFFDAEGRLDGPSTYWYKNGVKRSEDNYLAGKLHGSSKRWFKNGKPSLYVEYDQGTQVGKEIKWYENGKKMLERNYNREGQLHGIWKEWNEWGELKFQERYQYGKLIINPRLSGALGRKDDGDE